MNFYENFIVETRSPIPTAVSGGGIYKRREGGRENTKYSNVYEHVLGEKKKKKKKKSVRNSGRVRNIETINRRNCTVSRNKKITCTISEVSAGTGENALLFKPGLVEHHEKNGYGGKRV